jgi:hypothetical protein
MVNEILFCSYFSSIPTPPQTLPVIRFLGFQRAAAGGVSGLHIVSIPDGPDGILVYNHIGLESIRKSAREACRENLRCIS